MVKEEGGDKDQAYLCGTCGGSYSNNGEFWIGCDICENWYHGNCVASLLPRQSTSSSTSARLAATRGAESERGTLLADVVRVGRA